MAEPLGVLILLLALSCLILKLFSISSFLLKIDIAFV